MIHIVLKYIGPVPDVAKREWNRIKKLAYMKVGSLWHRTMRPKHFTSRGASEYGYTPRKGERKSTGSQDFRRSYTGRKLRQKDHTQPLVWSGVSKARTAVRDVRGTSKGSKVVLHAPALNCRNPHSNIDMRDEMTRISEGEAKTLTRFLHRVIDREFNRIQVTRKVKLA